MSGGGGGTAGVTSVAENNPVSAVDPVVASTIAGMRDNDFYESADQLMEVLSDETIKLLGK